MVKVLDKTLDMVLVKFTIQEYEDLNKSWFLNSEKLSIKEQLLKEDWEWWETVVDFWKDWIWKKDFEKYLSLKSSL